YSYSRGVTPGFAIEGFQPWVALLFYALLLYALLLYALLFYALLFYALSFMLYPLSKCRYFNHLLMIWDLILFDKFQA
ncbi:hypothetical protein, partial [Bacteroides clarus]|uniref:hypothetical protein n=1 Tax=Bacteroides clarus TaxID=626929 RepID=UPI003FED3F2E